MQSVLRNIERQVQEFQRQQQQQDLQSEIEHHHKLPVDIQIGDQVRTLLPLLLLGVQRTPVCLARTGLGVVLRTPDAPVPSEQA